MANNYNISMLPEVAAVKAVVDAIRATDVVNIRADIAALSLMSAKEKSLLGIGAFPGFRSYFNRVADGAVPDANIWTLVENGGGLVTVQNDLANKPGYLYCASGPGAGDDAIAVTKDKLVFSLKAPVTSLHLKCRLKSDFSNNATPTGVVGFANNDLVMTQCSDWSNPASYCAGVYNSSNIVRGLSGDGTFTEELNCSAWTADNTWFDFEVVVSAGDVKFYIDDVLRGTHLVRIPSTVFQLVVGATFQDVQSFTFVEYIDVWCE